ncbi:3-hydroxybutyryl-CoA dehydrogenase [Streptomyces longisporoflavus]|uniref:3-hydroxyacyl-CoA dehydrogenase family protein n=1 Tax=Streptomyces longisporoflavus TaxID=28044 RepID=UPI00167CD9EC|nr:3-hydroxyacyl-CoA dehydrogenase family protein [Streptomyces longisporoflavus]GGV25340.1 3-hydroxybutyryl-CoA dehydrogenase [Streptomyces longisporoflavus]
MSHATPPPTPSRTVGVVGAGTMGVGVAHCLAAAGHEVIVVDPVPEALDSAPARLNAGLRMAALLRRGPADGAERTVARVRFGSDLTELRTASFVIECARESIPVKQEVFRSLNAVLPPATVIATCTSAIPVGLLAEHVDEPGRVLGMHFMNPAYAKDSVEMIRGEQTDEQTLADAHDLLGSMGKQGIVVGDAPGFVSNRLSHGTYNDAAGVVQAGTADAATVDRLFQECFGHAMGPLRTADLIGLDTVVDTLHVLHDLTGEARFAPCALLTDLVAAGRLGRKSGQGFHAYASARR